LQFASCQFYGLVQFGLQDFAGWQLGQVIGHADIALRQLEELDVFLVFSGAQDEADGRVFAIHLLVFF
jgi:hypothetical protein